MYNIDNHNEIESFILKWTLITCYTGVIIIFGFKVIALLAGYVSSGKILADLGHYVLNGVKDMLHIHIGIGG